MTHFRRPLALASIFAFGLVGCQYFPKATHWVKMAPVPMTTPMAGPYAHEDALYARGVTAINQRDYGLALDVLQLARQDRANDPRVLAAMGVVYDKLGRFDLSHRYYDLAEAADPESKVVAIDRSYSLVLQQRRGAEPPAGATGLAEAAAVTRMAITNAAWRPVGLTRTATGHPLIGGPVRILNATGRPAGADRVQAGLAARGWSVARVGAEARQASPITRLQFPPSAERIAAGLAHTLPFPVKLESCANCTRMELMIGTNAVRMAKIGQPEKARQG